MVNRDSRHSDSRSLLVHLNILKNSSSIVALFLKAGAKVRLFFHPPNFFKFFLIFFFSLSSPPASPPSLALSLESGCKDKANLSPFPNFFTVIFHLFSTDDHNHVNRKMLEGKLFPSHPGKNGPGLPRSTGSRRDVTGESDRQKDNNTRVHAFQGHP